MNCVYFTPAAISASQYFTKQLQPENIYAKLASICTREENREENIARKSAGRSSDVRKLFQLALLISVLEQYTFVNDVYEFKIYQSVLLCSAKILDAEFKKRNN